MSANKSGHRDELSLMLAHALSHNNHCLAEDLGALPDCINGCLNLQRTGQTSGRIVDAYTDSNVGNDVCTRAARKGEDVENLVKIVKLEIPLRDDIGESVIETTNVKTVALHTSLFKEHVNRNKIICTGGGSGVHNALLSQGHIIIVKGTSGIH